MEQPQNVPTVAPQESGPPWNRLTLRLPPHRPKPNSRTAHRECTTNWSSNSCYKCLYGKYNPGNIPECEPCPAGTYADAMGMSECKACPGGTYAYASSEGTAACSKCPAGALFSHEHASECIACDAGFYSAYGSSECTALQRRQVCGSRSALSTLSQWHL